MLYLVFYDIENTSKRTKIAKLLIADGYERLQLSVYLGLDNPVRNQKLWKSLEDLLIDETSSKLYVLPIPGNSIKNIAKIGKLDFDLYYLAGEKDSLFF